MSEGQSGARTRFSLPARVLRKHPQAPHNRRSKQSKRLAMRMDTPADATPSLPSPSRAPASNSLRIRIGVRLHKEIPSDTRNDRGRKRQRRSNLSIPQQIQRIASDRNQTGLAHKRRSQENSVNSPSRVRAQEIYEPNAQRRQPLFDRHPIYGYQRRGNEKKCGAPRQHDSQQRASSQPAE
jgi:hypothetical protein